MFGPSSDLILGSVLLQVSYQIDLGQSGALELTFIQISLMREENLCVKLNVYPELF